MSETRFQSLSPEEAAAVGYERTEPNAFKIGMLTILIVAFILVSCAAVFYWYVGEREAAHYREVQVPVWQELKDVRAYETERLTQYKYIDKSAGKVQLPVARAMELLIQESAEGKAFYGGANAPVKPYEEDPGMQAVMDKALGKPPAPAVVPAPGAAAPGTPGAGTPGAGAPGAGAPGVSIPGAVPSGNAPVSPPPASKH